MKLLFIIFSLFLFLNQAQAQRKVGNGGGLAEMKMIYIDETLTSYISMCIQNPSFCKADQVISEGLADLQKKLESNPIRNKISFQTQSLNHANPHIDPHWDGPVLVDSRMIYTDGKPIDFSQLLAINVAIRLFQNRPDIAFAEYLEMTKLAFAHFSDDSASTTNLGSKIMLHISKFQVSERKLKVLLFLEDAESTFSLNSILDRCCGIGQREELNIGNIRFQNTKGNYLVLADLAVNTEERLLVIAFRLNEQGQIDPESIRISTRST